MSPRPSSAGIAVPVYIDTGRSGRFGRPPAPTMGSPSTSPDVTASQIMQQTMGRHAGETPAEDLLDPLGEDVIRDDIVINRIIRSLVADSDTPALGLFIPIPTDIVRKIEADFPIVKSVSIRDDSPPHITLLYIGHVKGDLKTIKSIVGNVAKGHAPFRVHLRDTDYFDNEDKSVMYIHAISPCLDELHYDLRSSMIQCGFSIEQSDFNDYVGHMTLQYLPPHVRIQNVNMEHSWIVDRFELWGAGSPVMFRLGEMTPISESSIIDEDEEEETEEIANEISAVGAVAGYTLPLGKSNRSKSDVMQSWRASASAFGNAKLA